MGAVLRRKLRRDLRRRRAQVVAVAVTVFAGVFLFAANFDAAGNLEESYRALYDRLAFADVWATGGPVDEAAAALRDDPDTTAVAVRTHADAPLRLGGRQLLGRVIGLPTDGQPAVNRLLVEEGRYLEPGDGSGAVILERHAADTFDLGPGDTVEVRVNDAWQPVPVVGVAASAEYVWLAPSRTQLFTVPDEFAVVFVPETLARAVAPGGPQQAVATVTRHRPEVATRLAGDLAALGVADAYTRAEQASNAALQSDVTGFEQLSFLFPVLFLSVAGMAAYVMLSRMVRTERTVIGMLVANGTGRRTILGHYTAHGLVVVLAGAVPGLVLGALAGRWISRVYTDFVGVPITVVRFSPATAVWALSFAVVVGVLAGGLPARAAAAVQPADAMRPPAPHGVGRPSLVERALPLRFSTGTRMVLRNLGRNRRRVLTTVVGVGLALVVVVTSFGLQDTVVSVIGRQFGDIDRRDLSVVLAAPVTDTDLARLAAEPGVAAAERFVEAPVVIRSGPASSEQLLQVFEAGTVAHGFATPLPPEGVLLGTTARESLGVAAGDTVRVDLPTLGRSVSTTVAGFVDEPVPSVSYASLEAWERAGGPPATTMVVTLTDRSTHTDARDALSRQPGVVAVTDVRASAEAVETLMGLTYVFVGLMVAFGVVMAVALIFNAVTVSLAERTPEVATLSANGVGRRWIRRTLTAENLLTVGLGVVPGLVAGWLVARYFVSQFDNESFRFDLVLRPLSLALSVVVVLGAALAAQWPGLRRLDRLDLATVVRERSI